jgi:hypothetical protein
MGCTATYCNQSSSSTKAVSWPIPSDCRKLPFLGGAFSSPPLAGAREGFGGGAGAGTGFRPRTTGPDAVPRTDCAAGGGALGCGAGPAGRKKDFRVRKEEKKVREEKGKREEQVLACHPIVCHWNCCCHVVLVGGYGQDMAGKWTHFGLVCGKTWHNKAGMGTHLGVVCEQERRPLGMMHALGWSAFARKAWVAGSVGGSLVHPPLSVRPSKVHRVIIRFRHIVDRS